METYEFIFVLRNWTQKTYPTKPQIFWGSYVVRAKINQLKTQQILLNGNHIWWISKGQDTNRMINTFLQTTWVQLRMHKSYSTACLITEVVQSGKWRKINNTQFQIIQNYGKHLISSIRICKRHVRLLQRSERLKILVPIEPWLQENNFWYYKVCMCVYVRLRWPRYCIQFLWWYKNCDVFSVIRALKKQKNIFELLGE